MICAECNRPEPREFCWDGMRLDCPFRRPPRHLSVDDLWPIVVDLYRRMEELTRQTGGGSD